SGPLPGISILDFELSFSISQTAVLCSCEPHSSSGSRFRPCKTGLPGCAQNPKSQTPSFQCLPQTPLRPSRPELPGFAVSSLCAPQKPGRPTAGCPTEKEITDEERTPRQYSF